jgi:RNA polymerase sigma-70 factor (ECF subfamily)
VFLVAWRKLDQIPSGNAALLWLYGVAFRVLSHRWRSTSRRGRAVSRLSDLAGEDMASAPETILVQSEEFRRVREAVSRLDSADQEILRLTLWEELSHAEVAAVLGIESGAAKQRAYRARQRLGIEYRRLAGEAPDPPAARKGKEVST